jgi:hypothetical protein
VTTKNAATGTERQIAAIRDLVHQGMRLVVDTRKDLRTLATLHVKLAEDQKLLRAEVRAFINSLWGNGHGKLP